MILTHRFVKDVKGREWDYCVLVTNDEKMDEVALSQLYRDRGDCEKFAPQTASGNGKIYCIKFKSS